MAAPDCIDRRSIYRAEEMKRFFTAGEFRNMRRRGLKVHKIDGREFVFGSDVWQFIERQDALQSGK